MKSEGAIEKEEWVGSQMAKMAKEFEDKKEQMKIESVQNRDKELKIVIAKLSEEKLKHKKKLEKDSESKLKLLQEKHNSEIAEYEKIIENLKDKIEKSTNVRRNLDDNFQTLCKKIQDQEQQIQKLENDKQLLKDTISNLQFKLDNYKEDQSDAIEEARKQESYKQSTLQQELDITKEQINLLKDKYEEKLAQFTQREAEEFEAIEARVKTTIMRKDEKIREIQEELQLSKLKVFKLEELLEKQRRNLMQF
jgi:chromosome segregation ATPase